MKQAKRSSKLKGRQKYNHHRMLTFSRMISYGLDSFRRNSWLSVAATAVMTITLIIAFVSALTQNILSDTLGELRNKVDMSIYLVPSTTDQQGDELVKEVDNLASVKSATFINSSTARSQIANSNSDDPNVIAAIREATNKTPATLRVVVKDINNTTELQNFVQNDSLVKKYISSDYKPSFAGERKNTIESIGRAVNFAQKVGICAGAVFLVISALIIFNTIRMAIFNRREEIEMMKLIGANHAFIVGPFVVEAILYGLIAAILATGLVSFGLFRVSGILSSYQITVQPTIDLLTHYGGFVLIAMMLLGSLIGVISSLLATRRYLAD